MPVTNRRSRACESLRCRHQSGTVAAWACIALLAGGASAQESPSSVPDAGPGELRRFVAQWCVECHSGARPKGRLDLGAFVLDGSELPMAERRRIVEAVAGGDMPPIGEPRPDIAARDAFLALMRVGLPEAIEPGAAASGGADPAEPGAGAVPRVVMRRLTRAEYANTVRDLLGVDFDVHAFLPADEVGHGFDTLGDTLALPPLLLEKYFDAAERIAAQAVPERLPDGPPTRRLRGADLTRTDGKAPQVRGDAHGLSSNGGLVVEHDFAHSGTYRIRVRAAGQQAGPEPVRIALVVDRAVGETREVVALPHEPAWHEFEATISAGSRSVGAAFVNDYYRPDDPDPRQRDRNCIIHALEIVGPLDMPMLTQHMENPLRDRDPEAWLGDRVRTLARRAYRRPVSAADVRLLLALTERDATPELRLRTAVTAMLVSPRFLFRPEPSGGAPRKLDGFEVATRLSYFVWSSMPDDALLLAAEQGRLERSEGIGAEVQRLLDDPRSFALAEHFATQWLQIRDLERRRPDPQRFPGVDDALLESMRAESVLLFDAVLREGRPPTALLDADFTFLDERLAQHYGVPGVRGAFMRRVRLPDARPRGVLGHASVLTATSNPTRTSPVKRGKWVLEAMLDAAPPPPPPGVASFERAREEGGGGTVREVLARHRADPDCAVCHRRMDELGFALERLDAVGRLRESENGQPVDDLGRLPDGTVLDGAQGVRRFLTGSPEFVQALVRHLSVFALGRALVGSDEAMVEAVLAELEQEPTLRGLVLAIVRQPEFRGG